MSQATQDWASPFYQPLSPNFTASPQPKAATPTTLAKPPPPAISPPTPAAPPAKAPIPPPPHPISPPTPAAPPPKAPVSPPSPVFPPPPHPISPPPPTPRIAPTPPPPSPGHHTAVIVVVSVSLGGLFFLAFLSVALFCFIKKRNKKMVQKVEEIDIDEKVKAQEAIMPGPHGQQAVLISIEEDIHSHERIQKDEIETQGHM